MKVKVFLEVVEASIADVGAVEEAQSNVMLAASSGTARSSVDKMAACIGSKLGGIYGQIDQGHERNDVPVLFAEQALGSFGVIALRLDFIWSGVARGGGLGGVVYIFLVVHFEVGNIRDSTLDFGTTGLHLRQTKGRGLTGLQAKRNDKGICGVFKVETSHIVVRDEYL